MVNKSYKKTKDVRKTSKETGVPFDEVWDMTGLKDWFDFYETDEVCETVHRNVDK